MCISASIKCTNPTSSTNTATPSSTKYSHQPAFTESWYRMPIFCVLFSSVAKRESSKLSLTLFVYSATAQNAPPMWATVIMQV